MAEFFADNDIRPHVITYEDFAQAPAESVSGIFDFLDIERPADFTLPAPKFERLSSASSEDWVQRFRREKQADFWTEFW